MLRASAPPGRQACSRSPGGRPAAAFRPATHLGCPSFQSLSHRLAKSPAPCHLSLVRGYFNSGQVVVVAIFKAASSVQKHGKCSRRLFPFWHNPIALWIWVKLHERVCTTHDGLAPTLCAQVFAPTGWAGVIFWEGGATAGAWEQSPKTRE